MTRRERIAFLTGAALMAAGTLLPWVALKTWTASLTVSGYAGHGAFEVVLLAAVIGGLALVRWEAGVVLSAAAAGLWVTYLMWMLPGSFTGQGGVYEAHLASGAGVTALGTFVVACAAMKVVLRHVEAELVAVSARRVARHI